MYDLHGSEQDFSNTFNPNNIDPNEIFRMFFGQGGDPFANLFGGQGGGFTVYTNIGGNTMFRTSGGGHRPHSQRQQQHHNPFAGGANIFDIFNELNEGTAQRRRRNQQQYQQERNVEGDIFNIFNQQRQERGRNNRQQQAAKTPIEAILLSLLNQCLP